jgi:hypothetical protein
MQNVEKHDHVQILNRSICTILENCTQSSLNNQVNEAAFMLQRFFEKFSLNLKRVKNSKVIEAIAKSQNIQTFDDIIIDIMKFDKTYTTLLFLTLYSQSIFFFNRLSHRSTLCIAFSDIVLHQ